MHFKRDLSALLVVEDVLYRPKWNLEVEQVGEFALDDLPSDTVGSTLRWIELLRVGI